MIKTAILVDKTLKSFLTSRHIWATYAFNNSNGYYSKWKKVQHGVPQGSVFGPFLFLLYINDLSKSVSDKFSPILFADDTSFITANRYETEFKFKTNEIFNEINKWFHSNILILNYDKIYFL
jgi:hypothetical protein